jgi:hypothetical protein
LSHLHPHLIDDLFYSNIAAVAVAIWFHVIDQLLSLSFYSPLFYFFIESIRSKKRDEKWRQIDTKLVDIPVCRQFFSLQSQCFSWCLAAKIAAHEFEVWRWQHYFMQSIERS